MSGSVALVTLVVREYDDAIAFFTNALSITLIEDTPLGAGKRWVVVAPPDFARAYRRMQEHGVRFAEAPREESYGTVAVFFDLYGNKWDLLQRREGERR